MPRTNEGADCLASLLMSQVDRTVYADGKTRFQPRVVAISEDPMAPLTSDTSMAGYLGSDSALGLYMANAGSYAAWAHTTGASSLTVTSKDTQATDRAYTVRKVGLYTGGEVFSGAGVEPADWLMYVGLLAKPVALNLNDHIVVTATITF